MSTASAQLDRAAPSPSLDSIISAYSEVTERLQQSHDRLVGEVRRLREQVDEKNRELARRERLAALGEMAAGVAHEIRNPLSGINLYAAVLARDLADRPSSRELAEKIVSGVRTLDGIVGDVLTFANQSSAASVAVSVEEVVQAVVESAEPQRQAADLAVHIAHSVAGARVWADSNQLQRALLNILLNAIHAAGEGGNVWIAVSTSADAPWVSIDIADDGPGVAPEMRDRVFNPFFTTKDSGTGLGLAIAHGIAEAHGGRVSVESRRGGGARFCLTLRSAAAAVAQEAPVLAVGRRSKV
ncbi:MAG: hypothetical protein GY842_06695 [bacterium]|nr:hypothetical protein [bacterium]